MNCIRIGLQSGRLWILGLISLLLGCLVYLLFYASKFDLGFDKYSVSQPLLQHIIHSLPSFLHVIAFTLLTLATYSHVSRHLVIYWGLFWGVINSIFEYFQRYSELPLRAFLPDWFVGYFEKGVFDWLDIIAIGLATVLLMLFAPILRSDQ